MRLHFVYARPIASDLSTVTNVSPFPLGFADLSIELSGDALLRSLGSGSLASMFQLFGIRLLVMIALLAALWPLSVKAQDDRDQIPLGDLARNLRKKTPPAKAVIDDDNLPQVMQEADTHHDLGRGLHFLMSDKRSGFQVEAPDVTCSLSFTANAKFLLAGQYAEMELPPGEMVKIEGKAVVEGDAFTVPVFNATQWHLSEITVAFTVLRKRKANGGEMDPSLSSTDPAQIAPVTPDLEVDAFQQVRPERRPDTTLIYRMRAAALPWSNAVFSTPLNMELAPGEEWHWAIVQAKGYPPEPYVSSAKPSLTQPKSQESMPSAMSLKSVEPENSGPIPPQPHE